jgi:hypothetical protein
MAYAVVYPCRNGLDPIGGTPSVHAAKAALGRLMLQRAFPLVLRDADFPHEL